MFGQKLILIVEDEPLVAMALIDQIERLDGRVVGPTRTVAQALAMLERQEIAAAILDANLADRDVTPVGLVLAERGVPFLIHSAVGIPAELARAFPSIRVIRKPAGPDVVAAHLLKTMTGD